MTDKLLPPIQEYLVCQWRDNGRILSRQAIPIMSHTDEVTFFHPQQADIQAIITRCRLIPEVVPLVDDDPTP